MSSHDDVDPIMISALEHYSYCPRQCALIHVEQVFEDNVYTVRGMLNHKRVDKTNWETRPEIRREYGLPLWSDRLGLVGRADLVEFSDTRVFPVEYKSGRKRHWEHEAIQLCAQALCLEEMLNVNVPAGAVYYHGSRARREVKFTRKLREEVERTTDRVRQLVASSRLPIPPSDERCPDCSLWAHCLPGVSGQQRTVAAHRSLTYRLAPAST